MFNVASISGQCAQRLSASSKESPAVTEEYEFLSAKCSTPVGVIEGFTGQTRRH